MAKLEDQSHRQHQGSDLVLNKLQFWKERQAMFLTLKSVAANLLAAPASQAHVEDFFSLWDYERRQLKSYVKVSRNKSLFEIEL
jgi:hypothetical protein